MEATIASNISFPPGLMIFDDEDTGDQPENGDEGEGGDDDGGLFAPPAEGEGEDTDGGGMG